MKETKEKTRTAGRRRLRNDLILIAILLALTVAVGLAFYFLREEGGSVRVTVDGEEWGVYSLATDRQVEIRTEKGTNLLVIRAGSAYIDCADCPQSICADHKPISRAKQSIVCLPHGVVVTVQGKSAGQTVDLIA